MRNERGKKIKLIIHCTKFIIHMAQNKGMLLYQLSEKLKLFYRNYENIQKVN